MSTGASFDQWFSILKIVGIAYIGYVVGLVIWRLQFSPLEKFPGPKLAAVTYWYEFYYNILLPGQYLYKTQELHKKYGPVIRINPHELHVSDPEFYHTLFAGGAHKRKRDPWHTNSFILDGCTLESPPHDLHRKRRAALAPFFSMQSTRRLVPVVQERIEVLIGRLEAAKKTGAVINLTHALTALSNDVITEYSYGTTFNRLEMEDFDPSFYFQTKNSAIASMMFKHFPFSTMSRFIQRLPDYITCHLGEIFRAQIMLKSAIRELIDSARSIQNPTKETIFHSLLNSSLPASEKSTTRLINEGVLIIAAGGHTVAWALSVACFHLLSQPHLLRTLQTELQTLSNPSLSQLEKLPYLTACIKESLRLSHGTSLRLPRIAPDEELQCGKWTIPPGTSVSMTHVDIHLNPAIFEDPHVFRPERWLSDNEGRLERYLVAFSAGSRVCLGLNLAWTELYLCLAGLFLGFGTRGVEGTRGRLELYRTGVGDVEICGDGFFPMVREGSLGIRVVVRA